MMIEVYVVSTAESFELVCENTCCGKKNTRISFL
jgi:hypothetical protein